MDISAATWNTVSKLLDEALDLDPAARAVWFEKLSAAQPALAPSVHALLAAHASSETDDVLARLPPMPGLEAARSTALSPGDHVGPYRLKRELGAGGMADVWQAERADGAFTRDVALKLPIVSRLRRDLAQRFARERDILARLEHPNIARFYDAGITRDGLPYLAMEYVDGQPVNQYCDQKRLDIAARLKLFSQVLDAVQFAHANLIIHRDLKPSNILVTATGEVRLLDFGIAKMLADDDTARETQLTQLSGRALTPDYASPEQIKGEPLTIATDVYSLGVVLYELLVGQRPYRLKVQSAVQLENAILDIDALRPSTVVTPRAGEARDVSERRLKRLLVGDLDTIALMALAKLPEQRYPSVAELARDLHNHLAGLPVSAQPPSWRYRAGKFVVRHRVAVGAAGAMVVILAFASAISLWQADRALKEANRAEEVKKFIVAIFETADVNGGGTRQTTGVDLLKAARERLDAAESIDTATRIELLTTIGTGLMGLSEFDLATPILADATNTAKQALGDEHPLTARAHLDYGWALAQKNEYQLATPHVEAAERVFRTRDDKVLLASALRLKSFMSSDADRSIALAWEALQTAETQRPPVDKRAIVETAVFVVATLRGYFQPGALEPARRAHTLAQEIYGSRLTDLRLNAHTYYAKVLADEGDPAAALRELQLILSNQIALFGENHYRISDTLRALGEVSRDLGDPQAAIKYGEQWRRLELARSGSKPTTVLVAAGALIGNAQADARRYPEALAEFDRIAAMLDSLWGADHIQPRVARSAAAKMLVKIGKTDEAEAIFAKLLQRPFSSPLESSIINARLALLRSAQGRHEEAEALMWPAVEYFAKSHSPVLHASYLADQGALLIESGKASEAVTVLEEARGIYAQRQTNGSPQLADLAIDRARALLALGRINEALITSGEAVSFWREFDPANPRMTVASASQASAEGAARRQGRTVASQRP